MKTAIDYPITFKFGGVWYPYYTKTPNPDRLYTSHHGEDRGMPTGTQVVVSGKTIGLSGNTGLSAAPHLHVDEKKIGANPAVRANFKNPNGWSTITGKVVFAGSAGTAGNMITIHTDKGLEYRFLHLSKINVKVGDKIGEDMVGGKTAKQWRSLYWNVNSKYKKLLAENKKLKSQVTWRGKVISKVKSALGVK